MHYKLYFDTSDNTKTIVKLLEGSKMIEEVIVKNGQRHSQILLPTIEKLLKKYKIKVNDLSKVDVNQGPGSYTGLRVGIAVANALAWTLGLKRIKDLIKPDYR